MQLYVAVAICGVKSTTRTRVIFASVERPRLFDQFWSGRRGSNPHRVSRWGRETPYRATVESMPCVAILSPLVRTVGALRDFDLVHIRPPGNVVIFPR